MTRSLSVSIEEGVAHVVLNRPEKRNAMGAAFWRELRETFEGFEANPKVRAALISSTGPHFSAGLDLTEFGPVFMQGGDCEGRKREMLRRMIRTMQASFTAIDRCPVPVIAAIQGGCIGGGVDLVSACDLRYGARECFFTIKEIDLAITADVGTLQRLPYLLPQGLVRELAYTGRKFTDQEAERWGLVNGLHDDADSSIAACLELARTIAQKSPLALRGTKEMLNYARDHSIEDGLRYVAAWNAGQLLSKDLMEAFASGMEKRAPTFGDLEPGVQLGDEFFDGR